MTATQGLGTQSWEHCQPHLPGPDPSRRTQTGCWMWTLLGRVTSPLLLARAWTSQSRSWDSGPCLFLSEQRISFVLVEVCGNILTQPWPDLKNKGSDANYTPPSPFLWRALVKAFGVLRMWATCLLSWHRNTSFSVPDSGALVPFGLTCVGHTDLHFSNTLNRPSCEHSLDLCFNKCMIL